MKTKRTFSTEEKLSILREGSENGVQPTLEKHGIYPATFYSWRKKFNEMGEDGLSHSMTPAHLKRIRELERENQKLKELVAEERLAGKLKDELLKKNGPWRKKADGNAVQFPRSTIKNGFTYSRDKQI